MPRRAPPASSHGSPRIKTCTRFYDAILWPASHYASANRTAYGWVIGGYANLFHGVAGAELIIRRRLPGVLTLPATLPILDILAWPIRLRRRPEPVIVLLLVSMLALIVSTAPAPRPHSPHVHLAGRLRARRRFDGSRTSGPRAAAFWRSLAADWPPRISRSPPVAASANRRFKLASAPFVEPTATSPCSAWSPITFTPAIRFSHSLTGRISTCSPVPATRRATPTCSRACFRLDDEHTALAELKDPPRWILYVDTPPESFLRIWPGSDPARLAVSVHRKLHRHPLSHGAEAGHFRPAHPQ